VLLWVENNHNDKSNTYKNNKDLLIKEISSVCKWALKKDLSESRIKDLTLNKDVCQLLLQFYPSEYNRQESLFRLFQGIKLQLSENKNLIAISQQFLLNICGLNSHNYQYVIEKLQEFGYIRLEKFGSPEKGHSHLYSYHGPDLLENSEGYRSLAAYIHSESAYHLYSKHTQLNIRGNINAI
jgi:hypothetical protein